MQSREEMGEGCVSQEPREGPISRRRLPALFNEVTRPWIEKWSLDCAKRNDETLSRFVGVWGQKLDLQTIRESRIICPRGCWGGKSGVHHQGHWVRCSTAGGLESDGLRGGEHLASFSKIWKIHVLSLNSRSYLSKEAHECNLMVLIKLFTTWCHERKERMGTNFNIIKSWLSWMFGKCFKY